MEGVRRRRAAGRILTGTTVFSSTSFASSCLPFLPEFGAKRVKVSSSGGSVCREMVPPHFPAANKERRTVKCAIEALNSYISATKKTKSCQLRRQCDVLRKVRTAPSAA